MYVEISEQQCHITTRTAKTTSIMRSRVLCSADIASKPLRMGPPSLRCNSGSRALPGIVAMQAAIKEQQNEIRIVNWVANMSFEISKFKFNISESSNLRTCQGSFSAVSKPNFATRYSLESSLRDLHNALLCTVL